MIGLIVKAGTEVRFIENNKEWTWDNVKSEVLTEDKVFFAEDIKIDPLGRVGCGPHGPTVGASWAKAGWYGFQEEDRCLLVRLSDVQAN